MNSKKAALYVAQGLALGLWGNPALAELQPRDLDQNLATIEAYYDTELNVTWLANTNIGKDESFGVPDAIEGPCTQSSCLFNLPGIDQKGLMEWPTIDEYMIAMNNSAYLGYSDWRLSTSRWNERQFPEYSFYSDEELPNILAYAYELDLANNDRDNDYLTSSIGEYGKRIYINGGSSLSIGQSNYDNLSRFAVWPLLDGDRGTPTAPINPCFDDDGDGYGWDGTQSCIAESGGNPAYRYSQIEPRDLDQNPNTIEAFYDRYEDVTWLANNRLASSNDFGLNAAIDAHCTSGGVCRDKIDAEGLMLASTARGWIDYMNNTAYLGLNQWHLPVVETTYSRGYVRYTYNQLSSLLSRTRDDSRTAVQDMIRDGRYLAKSQQLRDITVEYRTFFSTYSNRYYTTHENSNNLRYDTRVVAWPVHDGDVGLPIEMCVDTDGDGWGWNGTDSCKVAGAAPATTDCIDVDGDGWGWDGQASCIP